jgi:hypothetical protein
MCVLFLQSIRCIGLHLFLLGKFPLSIAETTRPRPISFPLEGEDSHIHIYIYIYIYARMCGNWGGETFFVGEATNFVNIIWFSSNMCFVSTIRNPFGAFRMHSKMSSFSKEKQHISSTLFDYHQICVLFLQFAVHSVHKGCIPKCIVFPTKNIIFTYNYLFITKYVFSFYNSQSIRCTKDAVQNA